MSNLGRSFSAYASSPARSALASLLNLTSDPKAYQRAMNILGLELGSVLNKTLAKRSGCLVASTAEDADYLSKGVIDALSSNGHSVKTAVFWNNHYQIPGGSVAPIVHKFVEPGFEKAKDLIVVKSVISGSCVVRTNILALIESINVERIFIVSPVMHTKSEESLRNEFPDYISKLFVFVYIAIDQERDKATGEVRPGIGGEIYPLLGLKNQPAKTMYMPQLVKNHLKAVHSIGRTVRS